MTLTEADKECLKLAIEMVRKRGGGDQQQIEKVLSARGFESAGPADAPLAGAPLHRRRQTARHSPAL